MVTYIVWCFGLTWLCNGLLIINAYYAFLPNIIIQIIGVTGAFSPTLAVIAVLKNYGAIDGRKSIWQFLFDFPKKISQYGILLMFLLWRFLVFWIAGNISQAKPLYMLFPILLVQLFFQGGLEEPGWRGFLQPYLEKKYPFIISVILVSVIYGQFGMFLYGL